MVKPQRLYSPPCESRHVPCQSLIFAQFLEGVCVQAALLPKRYCAETFKTQISEDLYAGGVLSSQNWPGFKPGTGASLTLCLLPIATYQLSPVSQVVLQSCGFMAFLIISDEPIGSPGYQGRRFARLARESSIPAPAHARPNKTLAVGLFCQRRLCPGTTARVLWPCASYRERSSLPFSSHQLPK